MFQFYLPNNNSSQMTIIIQTQVRTLSNDTFAQDDSLPIQPYSFQ